MKSTDMLCPFECGADPFKTQSDQKHHLMKKHAYTDKQHLLLHKVPPQRIPMMIL